ncbi:MAG: 16S rRNA (guanine(966)-N(2))-methyltransferase RsmD [Chloroflexales bacterium]|nr:16S rRNA (guanine(966)-N(2))-methyltransferase RsmD [Chloroflexales bacterium]
MRVITGRAKGRTLKSPSATTTRPMLDRVKESLFAILDGYGALRDARVLDLYAGSGALGIEALSRGAAWADFVEQRSAVCRIIAENLAATRLAEHARVHQMPVARFLTHARPADSYAIIFMDPPYADPAIEQTIAAVAASPLGAAGALLVVGHSKRVELADEYAPLQRLTLRRAGDACFSIYGWPEAEAATTAADDTADA